MDGAALSLLEPLARRGVMSGLASLMRLGSWGTLRSTVPPVTAPAWTSFITGKNPGGHGIYQFFSLNPLSVDSLGMGQKSYLAIPGIVVNSSRIPGQKLWSQIDRSGLRQILINLPMTYPPQPLNGLMITGMLTPPGSENMTFPPELSKKLKDYEIDLNPREKDFSGDDMVFLQRVEEILDKRIKWSLKLIKEENWDFFMVVFTETDRLQHRFYDLLDPALAKNAPKDRRILIPTLERLYEKIDRAVVKLTDSVGEDTRIVLLSDHGFGQAPVELVDLRVLTEKLIRNSAVSKESAPARGTRLRRYTPTKARIYRYFGFIPEKWLKWGEAAYRRRRLKGQKAIFFKMHENVGGVWINIRDSAGKIVDEQSYTKMMNTMKERLTELEWRGSKIVESVFAREELYKGPYLETAPDLIFVLEEKYGILEPDVAAAKGDLVIKAGTDKPRKKGTHRIEGMFLLSGRGIRSDKRIKEAAIEDMTATILYMLGLPIPEDMDGSVVTAAFDEYLLSNFPPRREAAVVSEAPITVNAFEPEEEEAIKERLEGIGYLD